MPTGRREQEEGAKPSRQEVPAPGRAAILLFEADVAQVSVVDADDAVVLLEEALLLRLAAPLQTLDQQAQSPETVRDGRQRGAGRHRWVRGGAERRPGGGRDVPGVWGGAGSDGHWI